MTVDVGSGRLVLAIQHLALARTVVGVHEVVRRAARQIADADGATFVLREGDRCHYVDEDAITPLWKGQRFPMSACISGWAMRRREAVVIPDVYADARVPHDAYRPTFVQSLVMVPIRSLDPIGAIGTYWATRHVPTEHELDLLQALADSTAVAMAMASVAVLDELAVRRDVEQRGWEEASTDELTGLANRRGFRLLAEQRLQQVRRSGEPAAVLFVDIDGLKQVNDEHGHGAGDDLIHRMSVALKRVFRDEDVLSRLGGDEFAVLAVGPALEQERLKERLAQEMAALSRDEPTRPALRASVGIALYEPLSTLDDLLALADAAMYVDKARRWGPHTSPAAQDDVAAYGG